MSNAPILSTGLSGNLSSMLLAGFTIRVPEFPESSSTVANSTFTATSSRTLVRPASKPDSLISDFIDKFKSVWTPAQILSNDLSGIAKTEETQASTEDEAVAQALVEHLNTIMDYKDRLESLEYLSNQVRSNFDNIIFTAVDESLANSIIEIGGNDNSVDFYLAQEAMDLVIEWIELTAADATSAAYLGKI